MQSSTWNISTTPTFLNEILNLPHNIAKQVPKKVKDIQTDPHSVKGDAVRLKDNSAISRIHVGKDYRLFYTFANRWIKLLSICHRRDCYRKIPNYTEEGDLTGEYINIELPNYGSSTKDTKSIEKPKKLITQDKLKDLKIPDKFWRILIEIEHEDDLLSLKIPSEYIFRLIDFLSPRTLDEIATQSELLLSEPENLDRLVEGEIELINFLLRLSEEQERIKDLQTEYAILVKGGPGTGKSIIALHRVKKLVDSGVQRILFTTYTESLASYSSQLLKGLLGRPPEQCGVEVSTVDSVATRYYKEKYGDILFPDNDGCLSLLQDAIRNLSKSDQKILKDFKIEYLLEEINIIIEARGISTLTKYLEEDRYGRILKIEKKQREVIWKSYDYWTRIMRDSGYISKGLMRQKALEIIQQAKEKPYDAVIIDEAQDISPIALQLLVETVPSPNGIYLTADTSQSLYQRGFSWDYIQRAIKFRSKIEFLRNSYRSTSCITKACNEIIAIDKSISNSETLSISKNSNNKGDKPKIFLTDDPIERIKKIKSFFIEASKQFMLPLYSGAVLVPNSNLGKITAQQLNNYELKAAFMEKEEIDIKKSCIKVMTLSASKGLEFPFVVLVGLEKGQLPNLTNVPSQEEVEVIKQQLRLFYVGCSRAMCALLVCASKTDPSQFISPLLNNSYWKSEEVS